MSPRGDDEASLASRDLDWPWLQSLNPKQIEDEDLQKLVPIITDWMPDESEERGNIICLFKLASSALKSTHQDLNEAMEALDDKEADKEVKADNKRLKKEIKELEMNLFRLCIVNFFVQLFPRWKISSENG